MFILFTLCCSCYDISGSSQNLPLTSATSDVTHNTKGTALLSNILKLKLMLFMTPFHLLGHNYNRMAIRYNYIQNSRSSLTLLLHYIHYYFY